MARVKFIDIKDECVAIYFSNQSQLNKLVDCLKAYRYDYGTGGTNPDEIKELGVRYFAGKDNQYLSLDRRKGHQPFISCGISRRDGAVYDFEDIDWSIE